MPVLTGVGRVPRAGVDPSVHGATRADIATRPNLAVIVPLALGALLAGCGGPELRFDYDPVWTRQYADRAIVLFAVDDLRAAVTSRQEPPDWVGFERSGFGIPYPVRTAGAEPFASQVENDLLLELRSLGFRVRPSPVPAAEDPGRLSRELGDPAGRGLAVTIRAWQTDAYRSVDVVYRFDVRVIDAEGGVVVNDVVQLEDTVRGTWSRERYEDAVQRVYAGAIRRVVRENGRVMAGLAGADPASPSEGH